MESADWLGTDLIQPFTRIATLPSFLTRMDFSFMWKKEYSKYLHWEKNLLARKELQPARAAYYTAENIFKKRRHELHKKFQFPLRYRDIEFMAKVLFWAELLTRIPRGGRACELVPSAMHVMDSHSMTSMFAALLPAIIRTRRPSCAPFNAALAASAKACALRPGRAGSRRAGPAKKLIQLEDFNFTRAP